MATDYRVILDNPEVDVVFIATGHDSHARLVCEALAAGKHVFVEKPLCLKETEMAEVSAAYQRSACASGLETRLLMVGFNRRMPEETNRVLTDHCSDLLFCPTETAMTNLKKEGITRGVHQVGDVMYDALVEARTVSKEKSTILQTLGLKHKGFLLATVHRAENTDDPKRLREIMSALTQLGERETLIFPAHPRTRKALEAIGFECSPQSALRDLRLIAPVGYLDMLQLEEAAKVVLTDSGGVQKEAFWLGTPCVTLRGETEWLETVVSGWNRIVGANIPQILEAALIETWPTAGKNFEEDGQAAVKCAALLRDSE